MKIALFHNLPSGGAKRHTLEQVRELARRGHRLVEFAPSTADLSYCSLGPYVEQQHIFDPDPSQGPPGRIPFLTPYLHAVYGMKRLQSTERMNRTIACEIDRNNFDVVFVKDCQIAMNPYVLRYLKTPSVFQCHHGLRHRIEQFKPVYPERSPLQARLKAIYYYPARMLYQGKFFADETGSIRAASRVLTNSTFSQGLLQQHYGVGAHVVYPGINTAIFRPVSVAKMDYVLSVGALIYSKGYRFLVSALARMHPDQRPSLFIAANSWDVAEEGVVRKMATRLGVNLHIERITNDERLVQVYNQARLFVYTPMQEALGMAPLEAMACGVPVVAVAEGGTCETVVDGVTGFLTERKAETFAERVGELLSDDQMQMKMGQAGLAYVRSRWTWQDAVDRLEHELVGVNRSWNAIVDRSPA